MHAPDFDHERDRWVFNGRWPSADGAGDYHASDEAGEAWALAVRCLCADLSIDRYNEGVDAVDWEGKVNDEGRLMVWASARCGEWSASYGLSEDTATDSPADKALSFLADLTQDLIERASMRWPWSSETGQFNASTRDGGTWRNRGVPVARIGELGTSVL